MKIRFVYGFAILSLVTLCACDPAMVFKGRIRAMPCPDELPKTKSQDEIILAPLPGIKVVKECQNEELRSGVIAISDANGIVDVVEIGGWGECDLVFYSQDGRYITQRHSEQDLCILQEGSKTCSFLSFDIDMFPVEEHMCVESNE